MGRLTARFSAFFGVFALVILSASLQSVAQMGGCRGHGHMMGGSVYNTGTEITISGTVDEVQQMTGASNHGQTWSCPHGGTGTHVMVKTDAGVLAVHVGPAAYLASKNFSIAKGDKLTILGSKVQYQGSDFLIAKQITKGNQVLTLRNSEGFPLWSGSGMDGMPMPTTPGDK